MLLLLLSLLLLLLSILADASSDCENRYPAELDIGTYWATINLDHTLSWTKSCAERMSSGFDPTKKSIWLVHGLQPGMVELNERMASDGELNDIIAAWVQLGYNFGIFQWTNFADEPIDDFVWAEDKVYDPHGLVNMQYRVLVGVGKHKRIRLLDARTDKSVSDYFLDEWRLHYPSSTTEYPEIRIVGHSLGTQLTVLSAYKIYMDDTIATKPARLALLDAVMSPRPKVYFTRSEFGRTVSENMGYMVRTLVNEFDVAIEYYKSSFINRCIFSSHEDTELIEYTAYTVVTMELWGNHPLGSCWDSRLLHHVKDSKHYLKALAHQVNMQHIYIVPYYLLSLVQPPHVCMLEGAECEQLGSKLAISAAMSTENIKTFSVADKDTGVKMCFHQYKDVGTQTVTPGDDVFYEKDCKTAHT